MVGGGGGSCPISSTCAWPQAQTVDELDQWTQKASWAYVAPLFGALCTAKAVFYIQVNDGGWKNCSSTTAIKLISGSQGQIKYGNGYTNGACGSGDPIYAQWTLKAASGSGGSVWPVRLKVTKTGEPTWYSPQWNITVNTPAIAGGNHLLPMIGAGN